MFFDLVALSLNIKDIVLLQSLLGSKHLMSIIELVGFVILLSGVWYWLDSMRAKEIATVAGARICKNQSVYFLDETVVLTKVRIRRNAAGHIVFYREYRFEFTSDGAYRYRGKINLLGKHVVATEMEPYRQDFGL